MPQHEGYQGYFEARGWDTTSSADNLWYYDGLQPRLGLSAGQKLLEIGFGDARFLDWSRSRGLTPAGVEILDEALAKARRLGHEVFAGPLTATTLGPDRRFDVVVAFDVLEHLTVPEIRQLFRDTLPHLAPDGRYIFRFPNGNSPFSGPLQCGDPTHCTLVSPGMVGAIAAPLGLEVERSFNDRVLPPGFAARTRRRLVYALRGMIETVLGFAYFGRVIPMDPNVFVIVRRTATSRE
jgi:SAM-dependent methyltransferase